VPASFPYGVAVRLQEADVEVAVVKGPLFPGRAVKKPDEIRAIVAAQQAAVIAMRAAATVIGQCTMDVNGFLITRGTRLTAEMVRATISRTLIDHNCSCGESIIACGPCGADPHEVGRGPLRAHEPIVIDIFPQHLPSGYWGDLTRTMIKGVPSPIVRRMYNAVKAAQAAALDRVKAGAACAAVHEAAEAELQRRGFEPRPPDGLAEGFIHSTGHGVGLSLHEAPSLGANRTRLRSGNVITIEPGLYCPGVGGMRIEDTVLVTATGWKYLAPCEKRREI
jgi:Xaa-Pro aminopeptidase